MVKLGRTAVVAGTAEWATGFVKDILDGWSGHTDGLACSGRQTSRNG